MRSKRASSLRQKRAGKRGRDLRERSWRLRCSLREKARAQYVHLYFFSTFDFVRGLGDASRVAGDITAVAAVGAIC